MSVTYGCISCLETDNVFNIFDTHECEGIEEVYVNMLKICFDVTISDNPALSYMCENCILNLRQAYYFKQNVVKNLEALQVALASQIQIECLDETPNLESQLQMQEQLDPETGQMTLIVTEEANFDTKQVYVEYKDITEDIKENNEEISNKCITEDVTYSLTIDRNHEEMKISEDPASNDAQLAEGTHFECSDCGKRFPNKLGIARHVKTHLQGTFPCQMCGKEFSKLNSRNSHQWRVHRTRDPYACAHCDRRFPTFHQRLRHLEAEHGQRDEYPCPHCSNVYSYAGARSTHVRETHLREHRHRCAHCRMGFFKRAALLNHLASVHDIGEKKHVCPICDKSFYRFPILRNHMKLHVEKSLKDKKHECHICHAYFTYKTVLKNHMKCHEMESKSQFYIVQQNVPVE